MPSYTSPFGIAATAGYGAHGCFAGGQLDHAVPLALISIASVTGVIIKANIAVNEANARREAGVPPRLPTTLRLKL